MSDKIERFYFIPKEKGTPDNAVINCEEFAKRIVTNQKQNKMNNSWFEVKAKYTKQLEDGRLKRVTEPYLV